jgi:NADH:ubiquinone oxidoreductase subunit 5 (subunit L)/multisubunit Na+/H+ antiporter MnhA subunit
MSSTLLPLLAPVLLLVTAASRRRPGRRPGLLPHLAEGAALAAFAVAVATAVGLVRDGPATSPVLGIGSIGLAARIDVVSVTLLLLVTFVGWIVLRFARTYVDGEDRQGRFTGLLCATLASVLLLVQSGTLLQLVIAWIATGALLHRLLLFYPDRIAARRAARKKFVTARAGDAALLVGAGLLAAIHGTGDIAAILEGARAAEGPAGAGTIAAAALLAVAALLKSAQFPAHGWLTEVMETPTPVSALLHAGLINAGGFLLIRFADVMLQAPGVLAVLTGIGGFTALFAGCVMLTQTAVKTSLAWSTVAQMGFMILQCGLTLFPLALLHIVAHSLYKAHAFLASGGAVEQVASIRRPGPVAAPDVPAVTRAIVIAVGLYAIVGTAFGFGDTSPQAIALGAILVLGVAYLVAQGLADAAPRELGRRTALMSVAAAVGYFVLHALAGALTAGTLPPPRPADALEWTLIVLAVASFGSVAVGQATFPLWAHHPAVAGLRVHLANGFYANALLDRALGGWAVQSPSSPTRPETVR